MQKLYYVKKQYYQKDKKAQIYKLVPGEKDPYGFRRDDKYKPVAPKPLWCYTKQMSQEQKFAAAAYGEKEERLFIFNFMPGIEVYDHILYKGDWYSVTRVDTTEDYNTELFIYVYKERSAPKDDEFLPYGEDNKTDDTGSDDDNDIEYDEDGFPIYH